MRPPSAELYGDAAKPSSVDSETEDKRRHSSYTTGRLAPPRRRHSQYPKTKDTANNTSNNDTDTDEEGPTSSRKSFVSRDSDDGRMKEALLAVNDAYNLERDHSSCDFGMQDLKDHLMSPNRKIMKPRTPKNKKNSASSSMQSSCQESGNDLLDSGDCLSDDLLGCEQFYNGSMDVGDLSTQAKLREKNNRSSQTLPMENIVKTEREKKRKHQIKTDQIIESIVWFSFHIPRTVLEDLIAHELELWRNDDNNKIKKSSRRSAMAAASQRRRRSKRSGSAAGSLASSGQSTASEGSLSSLSDEGGAQGDSAYGASHSEKLVRREQHGGHNVSDMIRFPKAVEREAAILFVDMSGFTKLSTLLDVESLSKVINSYFDMIVSEVILFGGDILKFAGDAFFAEWRVVEETDTDEDGKDPMYNPLSELNASLVSISEMVWDDVDVPPLANCVMLAAKCATSIVQKFSDYHVSTADSRNTNEAMLNVHCGVGVGRMVGLHVRDYKEGQEEEAVELRREFLILGEPIDQVLLLQTSFGELNMSIKHQG